MVTKDYFDWFLIHGKYPLNNIDVIRSGCFSRLSGSICATQIHVFPAPDLHTEDDLTF